MWIARDKNGNLFLYNKKPYKDFREWGTDGDFFSIDGELFSEVKWEDKEPHELVLKPVNKE